MSTSIRGYVEVLWPCFEFGGDDELWMDVLNIGSLASQNYHLFCRLFGVRCSHHIVESIATRPPFRPVAPSRGLPRMPSMAAFERLKSMDENAAVSWATFEEIEPALPDCDIGTGEDASEWEWRFIIDSMRRLAEKVGKDRVRMVVGFDY